jgi:hypothetical protein
MRNYGRQAVGYPLTNHAITMSASSQQTPAFGAQTHLVRIATKDQPARIAVGENPTATATSMLIPSAWSEYLSVRPGEKIAVLQGGVAGDITITEMTA